jgi:hypothetical protein
VVREIRVAEGRARRARIWTIRWGSRAWLRVAGDIGRCVLPEGEGSQRAKSVPRRLAHLFWNVDVEALRVARDGHYIADRILRDGDAQGLAWLARNVRTEAITAAARGRGLERRRASLGRVLAAG